MNKFVVLTVFCAVISVSHCGYENSASYGSDNNYYNPQSLGYSQHSAASQQPRYFTNSLDYNPGQYQPQYQYPQYQQDDLKKEPEYIPEIGENGVPKDTPEVQKAKSEHFALFQRLAEAAAKAPENEGNEEEEQHEKNIYQKYQSVQPQQIQQQKINYIPKPVNEQHFTQVLYPKYAPAQPRPQPQPQPQQYHHPAPVSAPVRHHAPPAGGQRQRGIFIVGPDEPKEVQKARAEHLAAHKDVLAYIHHSRKHVPQQSPKYYSGEHQQQSYAPSGSYAPSAGYAQSAERYPSAAGYATAGSYANSAYAVSPEGYSEGYGGHPVYR